MDKRILEQVLADQAEELAKNATKSFCKRQEEDLIELDSPQAQVVIGVRRSGKSTLCYNVLKKRGVKFAYVNFDDERLVRLKAEDLNDVLEVLYKINGEFDYMFIDEIQNIPEWYLFVNRLLRRGMHMLITGSNSKLLSGELASHLTGRHHSISLYPFSFAEFCEVEGLDTKSMSTQSVALRRAAFDRYLRKGGFPELQFVRDDKSYINELVNNILTRDIEQRFKVRYTAAFEQMSHHLMNIAPAIIEDKAIQERFGFKSAHTSKNYISYLKQAFLLVGLQKYSPKSKIRTTAEKVYPIDLSLMNKRENAFAGPNLGWRLETIVYLELLRRYKPRGADIYYYGERNGECDFVVCEGNRTIMGIQVCYNLAEAKTMRREVSGLLLAARKTGCEKLLLITDHEYSDIEKDGHRIMIRPAYDLVLSADWDCL